MNKIITIDGRKIEYMIKAFQNVVKGKGKKTVVIMPGMGGSCYEWSDIVEEVAEYATVIIIHRPGVGHSELHPSGSNTKIASEDAYKVLNKLNIEGKVILAGHSYGGLCVQHFARLYPEKVESVLLVESSSIYTDEFNKLELPVLNETGSDEVFIKLWTNYSKKTKEELKEEIKPSLSDKEMKLPLDIQEELLDFYVRPEIYRNQLTELIDLRAARKNMSTAGEFPECPLTILIRDEKYTIDEMVQGGIPETEAYQVERLWQKLSNGLKELSVRSKVQIVEKSNHSVCEKRPDVVIQAIRELVDIE